LLEKLTIDLACCAVSKFQMENLEVDAARRADDVEQTSGPP